MGLVSKAARLRCPAALSNFHDWKQSSELNRSTARLVLANSNTQDRSFMTQESIQLWGQTILIIVTVGGTLGGLFLKYVKPRIGSWWGPYRDGIQSMKLLQGKLDEITSNQSKNHESTTTKINAVATDVATLASITRARADANPHEANFEANSEGLLVNVNKTYTRWVNRELKEVLNHGWKNQIHPLDRERVSEEWDEAIRDSRASTMRYRLLDGTLVEATATPIPEGVIPCERWVGVIRRVIDDQARIRHDGQ